MKKNIIRLLVTFLLAALPFISHAQLPAATAAWTRGVAKTNWQAAIATTRFVPSAVAGSAQFLKPLAIPQAKLFNINKDHNALIWAQVEKSNLFTETEKNFLTPFADEDIALSRLVIEYDKNAAFYNQVKGQPDITVSEEAFANHQGQLTRLISTLEQDLKSKIKPSLDYESKNHKDIISVLERIGIDCGFPRSTIAELFQSGGQPLFVALSAPEMEKFAQQPDLASQKVWVDDMVYSTQIELERILLQPESAISPFLANKYYVDKIRLQYFTDLKTVLAKASAKRPSIIIRYRSKLTPDGALMTDAQRLGYLYYQRDITPTNDMQKRMTLETQISEQEKFSQEFAAAESLGSSYELALRKGSNSPLLLSDGEQEEIFSFKTVQQFDNKIATLERQMATMRAQTPGEDLDFYTRYYSLVTRKDIYESWKISQQLFNKLK